MMWKSEDRKYPLMALAFNHRAEAFYRADEVETEQGECNPYVKSAKDKGLTRVPVLHPGTGDRIASKLIKLMNEYHEGSGISFIDFFDEALSLESLWKTHCTESRLTSHNPNYASLQQQFILGAAKSADFSSLFSCWEHYKDTVALVHSMSRLGIKESFEEWCNNNVEFLEGSISPQKVITQMHSIALLVQGNMRRYYSKSLQAIVVLEALKFTARGLRGLSCSNAPFPIETLDFRRHVFCTGDEERMFMFTFAIRITTH